MRKKIFLFSLVLIGALATMSAFADEASNGEGYGGSSYENAEQAKVWGGEDHPAEEEGNDFVDRPQGSKIDPELAANS
jgi:hypothetical protein